MNKQAKGVAPGIINRLGYVALRVTDLDRSVKYAVEIMGLREVVRENGASYLTCNDRHHELVLIEASEASLDHIGLEVQSESDMNAVRQTLADNGFDVSDDEPAGPGVQGAFLVVGWGGFAFKVFYGMAHDQPPRYATLGEKPEKFGHVTLKVTDLPAMAAFLTDQLGFRISDRMGTSMAWLRCNFDHHGIGLIQDDDNKIHHYAFDLQDFTAIGRVGDHLRVNGQSFIWGPGRHGPGDNLFCYFFDPEMVVVEYQADLQQIDDEANYFAGEWVDEPITVNQWGTPPPQSFHEAGIPIRKRITVR